MSAQVVYNPGLVQLWEPFRALIAFNRFAELYMRKFPEKQHLCYRRVNVLLYTRSHKRRAARIVVDPNVPNAFEKFLWDIRCAFGNVWDEAKNRARLVVDGRPLQAAGFVPALLRARPYALEVEPSVDGEHVLPSCNPVASPLGAAAGPSDAPPPPPEQAGHPVMCVLKNIANNFATSMTEICQKANTGSTELAYRMIADPGVSRGAAIRAALSEDAYRRAGFGGAEDFFAQLGARSVSAGINVLSGEMAAQMRKLPSSIPNANPEQVRRAYAAKAIAGPICAQWLRTLRDANSEKTARFRVANDFSLAQVKPSMRMISGASERKWASYATAPANAEIEFAPLAFAARSERARARSERFAGDRRALARDVAPVQAGVDTMPSLWVPGSSLAGTGSSMPGLVPIAASSSMPQLAVTDELGDLLAEHAVTRGARACVVPDERVFAREQRAGLIEHLRGLNERERAKAVAPYVLQDSDDLAALLSARAHPACHVRAANGRAWRLHSKAGGDLVIHARGEEFAVEQVTRGGVRLLYVPVTLREGQPRKV